MRGAERIRGVLEMIACPACHGRLAMSETGIGCTGCGRRYPIEDGIPVLLVERGRRESVTVEEGIDHPVRDEKRDEDGNA